MNPSYVRIQLPLADAAARFADWIGLPEIDTARRISALDAVSQASTDGKWRAVTAVLIHERAGWTVFDDLTGYLASFSAARWAQFAGEGDLVFAGYNDSVPYGQLVVVSAGIVVREFIEDLQNPSHNVNRGRLDFEAESPIQDWTRAASFVDGDDLSDAGVTTAVLRLFGRATEPAVAVGGPASRR